MNLYTSLKERHYTSGLYYSYLLFVGIKNIKTRVIYLPKLFIIPLILLAIKYKANISDDALVSCLVIMGGSIAGFFINTGNTLKVIKKECSVEVPGGYGTLIVLLSLFLVKYYFGYLESTDPDLFLKYSIIESVISGLFSGYSIGRTLTFTYKYLKAAK